MLKNTLIAAISILTFNSLGSELVCTVSPSLGRTGTVKYLRAPFQRDNTVGKDFGYVESAQLKLTALKEFKVTIQASAGNSFLGDSIRYKVESPISTTYTTHSLKQDNSVLVSNKNGKSVSISCGVEKQ